jgi:hypothetical protein
MQHAFCIRQTLYSKLHVLAYTAHVVTAINKQCLRRKCVHTSAEPSNSSAHMEVCAASSSAAYNGADSYNIFHGVRQELLYLYCIWMALVHQCLNQFTAYMYHSESAILCRTAVGYTSVVNALSTVSLLLQ